MLEPGGVGLDLSNAKWSFACGCSHFITQEESMKRVFVPFGMFIGQINMRAVSV